MQVALESATDDMDLMARLLDELDTLQKQAELSDLYNVDVNINKMMPELGFTMEDADKLVASFSGGWQMRIALGKILLQVLFPSVSPCYHHVSFPNIFASNVS